MGLLFALPGEDLTPEQKYIETYAPIAISEMERTGVPASITLAQAMLESKYGESELAAEFNNHFGIKCHSDWKGAKTYYDDDQRSECFRVYASAEESFRDHSDFLRYQSRYASLFDLNPYDYKSWARGLKASGYATDPAYAVKLIQLIEEYSLTDYDHGMPEGKSAKPAKAAKASKETKEAKAAARAARPARGEKPASTRSVVSVPKSPRELEKPHLVDNNYKERYEFPLARPVYEMNGVPFVYAMEGETYESIALANNLFRKEILRYNDLEQDTRLDPGTVVYLQAKKSQAPKGLEKYIVGPDEKVTLRDIAQKYAVKEASLRSMNKFEKNYIPLEGDTILLRK